MKALKKAPEAACGGISPGSSAKRGPVGPSLKTCAACSPAALRESCKTWPTSGMMRNGKCSPLPHAAPRTIGKGCSLLPTPVIATLTQGIGFSLRSRECWEKSTSLGAYLIGLEYGLTGQQKRPRGTHTPDVSFIEWMMGVPQGWTEPQGPPLTSLRI